MKSHGGTWILCAWLLAGCVFLAALPSHAAIFAQIGKNFTGATFGVDSQSLPPDSDGAAGPAHFVEFINGRFSVFQKSSGARVQTRSDRAFWANAGVPVPSTLIVTDARIFFDASAQRWFACQVDVERTGVQSANRFLIAVSKTADPTDRWSGFAFQADPDGVSFADFPTMGVDANAVYLSAELFNDATTDLGPILVSIPKSDLLADTPTIENRTSLGKLDPATHGRNPQPAFTIGNASTSESVLGVESLGEDLRAHSGLRLFTVENAGAVGAATAGNPTTIRVPLYTIPINSPQPGDSHNLDNGDARFSAAVYRVADLLYAVHTTEVRGRAALQWFVINATNSVLVQSGIIARTNLDLFYPSIAANTSGIVVIGCNGSSSNSFVSCYALAGETVRGNLSFGNLMLLKAGSATYSSGSGTSRWGDYSATSVDPSDPNRFWTIQLYPSQATAWSTQITELMVTPVQLNISQVDRDVLLLTWPTAAAGFQLQFSPTLGNGDSWAPISQSPSTNGDQFTILIPTPAQGFYRLVKP